jgi:hypothetical protein
MPIQREAIMEALFGLINQNPAFNEWERRLKQPDEDVSQPAIYQRITGEDWAPMIGYGQPQMVTLHVEVWMYTLTGGPDDIPEQAILPLLDALDAALITGAAFDGRQQLGLEGYVQHAWREGETVIAQGELETQAVVVVPMRILVSGSFAPAS